MATAIRHLADVATTFPYFLMLQLADVATTFPFFLMLQVLSTRARKDVKVADIKVQVCLYAFDCLFLNGQVLVDRPLTERREALYSAIQEKPGELFYATAKVHIYVIFIFNYSIIYLFLYTYLNVLLAIPALSRVQYPAVPQTVCCKSWCCTKMQQVAGSKHPT